METAVECLAVETDGDGEGGGVETAVEWVAVETVVVETGAYSE